MKFFNKEELTAVSLIFLVLIAVSWPNFSLSLRRARDQIRRDDMGNIQASIDAYYHDYGIYPASTSDGKIIACKDPNAPTTPKYDANGNIEIDMVACTWGKDPWVNLTPGVNKEYMKVIPGDPQNKKGVSYAYFSDGSRYQLFGSLEGVDEPGFDNVVAVRGVWCGSRHCNMGRANNVPLTMTIEEYNLRIYCGQHPNDVKCINKDLK